MEKLSFNKDKYQQPQKATTHYWQDRALKVMEELGIDKRWTGSIMRHFKRKPEKAEAVYRNMAGKTFKDAARYFHKLMAL